MSETTESEGKSMKLDLNKPKKLELKKTVETSAIRQSFSHGRTKMVQVEVRKKRTFARDAGGRMSEIVSKDTPKEDVKEAAEAAFSKPDVLPPPDDRLTSGEREVRARALEEARRRAEEEANRPPEPDPEPESEQEVVVAPVPDATPAPPANENEEDERRRGQKKQVRPDATPAKRPTRRGSQQRRRSGKLTIAEALVDGEERMRSLASVRRARDRERQKAQRHGPIETRKQVRDVTLPETITVQELANRMAERGADVIKSLMNMGFMATINDVIDADTAELVVAEFGHKTKRVSAADVEFGLKGAEDAPEQMQTRPPVVTVMGHVDHGKTSLLDVLRTTDVAAHEAGGITQHIGAYQVQMPGGEHITFIDTPGHAAFSEMRSRGARVTDIIVLCVAANDGVMPQTIEAINHAKAAGVPMIVAINKIDLPDADPNRVKTALLQHDVVVEDMGGETQAVEVSAKNRANLDKLEEAILLQAELLELKANPDRGAEGTIVESRMEQGRGSVATVLVQRGTLRVGDIFVAGAEWGKVRALVDDRGKHVRQAGPGAPAEILGLNGTPMAGDEVTVVDSEARAREVVEYRQQKVRDAHAAKGVRGTLEQMFEKIREGDKQVLPVVIKGDVHGSIEALAGAIEKLGTEEVEVKVLHGAVGGINESDITLASASSALVIGFSVRANPQAREMARRDGIEIRYYSIIYNVIDDLRDALTGMLSPERHENLIGYAEIREVFTVSKVGKVAGCMVTEGLVKRGAGVRLLRDNVVVHEGELSQLKRFRDDARDVREGMECGMAFASYQDIQVGDMIECFEVEERQRKL